MAKQTASIIKKNKLKLSSDFSIEQLEKEKLFVEIYEIKKRSSYLFPIIKYVTTGVILAFIIGAWALQVYIPNYQINSEIIAKRNELSKLELEETRRTIALVRDSLTKENILIQMKYTDLNNSYQKLAVNQNLTKAERDSAAKEVQRLRTKMERLEVVVGEDGKPLYNNDGTLIFNDKEPITFDKPILLK